MGVVFAVARLAGGQIAPANLTNNIVLVRIAIFRAGQGVQRSLISG